MSKPRRPRPVRNGAKATLTTQAPHTEDAAVSSSEIENAIAADEPTASVAETVAESESEDTVESLDALDVDAVAEPAAFEAVAFEAAEPIAAPAERAGTETVPATEIVPATGIAPVAEAAQLAPAPVNAEAIGATFVNYLIGEGEAFAAHLRALAGARSMADLVRLQIGEFQRAANASLTCWGVLTLSTSRTLAVR